MTPPDNTSSAKAATVENSPRLAQFQAEVDQLGVTGGRANTERRYLRLGILAAIVGLILVVAAYFASDSSEDFQDQIDMIILAMLGVGLVILGGIFIAINTITRFLRYWLVRLVYELREQTDKLNEN